MRANFGVTDLKRKPDVMSKFEAWALPVVGAAFGLATVVNAIVHPVADWLPMLFIAAFVGFASYWGMRGILRFQKVNSLTMRRETYESTIWFFFVFGLLFAVVIVVAVVFGGLSGFPMIYGLAIPAGMSMGAASQWELHKHFRSKDETAV
jgi:hypothetical protein